MNEAKLRASEAICALFVERGTTNFRVIELANACGLAERTFYRYFPTKQEAVRPVLDWGADQLAIVIRQRSELTIADAAVAAFDAAVGGSYEKRTRSLFPLLLADSGFRAVLLQALHDGENVIRPVMAERLRVAPYSPSALVAAASVMGMIRVSLDLLASQGRDPVAALRESFALLNSPTLAIEAYDQPR